MGKNKLKGKDLDAINYKDNKAKSLAIDLMSRYYKHKTKAEKLDVLKEILIEPTKFLNHEYLSLLAQVIAPKIESSSKRELQVLKDPQPYAVFGKKHINVNAIQQMDRAMQLPIVNRGALMPDAHQGYGLPIGGVLASESAVIPYGVGVDIGCRMSLSLFDLKSDYLKRYEYQFKSALKEYTNFGTGGELMLKQEHEVLDRDEFKSTPLLTKLHGKAVRQLGSSGSGNHFVEFGHVNLKAHNDFGVEGGEYLGLLSHSGSRGFGATIAQFYTDIAMKECLLPKPVQHLAWLDVNSEYGREYWLSMNLAGDYAKACHDQIHKNLSRALGLKAFKVIENHHNFAWKEVHDGKELIVHRKGATPAALGELGVIPGSMTSKGYIVRGKGNELSINSASHGAGRLLSRSKAKSQTTVSAMKKVVKNAGVSLIGGGPDEAPFAYKNIEEVMLSQTHLVDVLGDFTPKIVRMDKR